MAFEKGSAKAALKLIIYPPAEAGGNSAKKLEAIEEAISLIDNL